jgi:hypothetical protein
MPLVQVSVLSGSLSSMWLTSLGALLHDWTLVIALCFFFSSFFFLGAFFL